MSSGFSEDERIRRKNASISDKIESSSGTKTYSFNKEEVVVIREALSMFSELPPVKELLKKFE